MKVTDGRITANVNIYENGTDVTNDLLADNVIGYMPESNTYIVSNMDYIAEALDPELSEIDGIENMETFFEEVYDLTPAEDAEFFTAKYNSDVNRIIANKGSKYDKLAKATHRWIDRHFNEFTKDEQDYILGCDYDTAVDLFANCDSITDAKALISEYKEG